MRIIVERDREGWSAWEESEPDIALAGSDPAMAVKRLCHALGVDIKSIAPDQSVCRRDHLEFVAGDVCADCNGSGRYVGLNTVEVCGTCGGRGRVLDRGD